MKKKGISPLIATVLIIGFTVALAAIIITWSTSFTKKMQEQTEQTANTQVICATDVVFGIKSVCKCAGVKYGVLIQNDGKQEIKNWKVRLYENENKVDASPAITISPTTPLAAFGIQFYTFTASTVAEVKKVEVFPVIEKGLPKEVTCSQNVDSFGDASSTDAITTLCSPAC